MEINITLFLQVCLISMLAIFLSSFLFPPLKHLTIQRKKQIIHLLRQLQSIYIISKKNHQYLLQHKLIIEKNINYVFQNKKNKKIQKNFDNFQKTKIKIFIKFREQMNYINMKNNEIKTYFLHRTNQISSHIFYKINDSFYIKRKK